MVLSMVISIIVMALPTPSEQPEPTPITVEEPPDVDAGHEWAIATQLTVVDNTPP